MTCPPNKVQTKLEELVTCLCAEITRAGLPELCFCGLLPGSQIALDYANCAGGTCGMAWVRLITFYPSTVLGQPSQQPGNCGLALGADVELGIARCAAVGDEEGNPPSAAESLADTELQIADAMAMRQAVICCNNSKDYMIVAYTPFGPEGGMVGGTLTVSLQMF